MSLTDLYAKPGHLIRRAHQISWALFLEECAAFNITPVQYSALVAIDERPGVDATRLSALIAFDRSTIGNVLDRLENRGLIRREASAQDRRQKLLHLTREGKTILRQVRPLVLRVQNRILAPLSEEERATLLRLLTRLTMEQNEVTSAPIRSYESLEKG
jgi:DNA-binding MarR family transcriptional regulator